MRFEGRQLGNYQLHHLIGRGGAGDVYLAEDQHITRQVAVKITQSEDLSKEAAAEATRLFQREARAIAMLSHPHILPLFDFGEEHLEGMAITYLVIPFCPEGSLITWLRKRNKPFFLTPQELVPLIQQAADALAYAHEQGIIHRDIKPSNFLVRSSQAVPGQPYLLLADFGIARFTQATANVSQTVRGTPGYMSPEQWRGESGSAGDQYSLGIMAYELLTGQQPFKGTQQQIMYHHCITPPQPPSTLNPHINPGIDGVILRSLAKKPEERFASITDFAYAFTQAVQMATQPSKPLSSPLDTTSASAPTPGVSTDGLEQTFAVAEAKRNTPQTPIPPTFLTGDLHASLTITNTDAARGITRSIMLPNGQTVDIMIPRGAYDGQKFYVEQPQQSSDVYGQSGNLIIDLAVIPSVEREVVAPPPGKRTFPIQPKILFRIGLLLVILTTSIITLFSVGGSLGANKPSPQTLDATYTAATTVAGTQATATAGANATAAVVYNPYDPNFKTLTLYEQFKQNSASKWDENGTCKFANDGYHAMSTSQGPTGQTCIANNTDFQNVSVEARMTLLKGSGGGIVLFAPDSTSYYFHISADRTYTLQSCAQGTCTTSLSGYSSEITPNQQASNLIALATTGTELNIYVNKYSIGSIKVNSVPHAHIGLAAKENSEVVFNSVKAWTT